MVDTPLMTVVVPVRDDRAALLECIGALQRQNYPRDRMEIIVVDDGSSQPVTDVGGCVRVVRQEPRGSYAARNEGIRHARGSVLAFTDSDCLPAPDWLSAAVRAVATHEGAAIAGSIEVPADGDQRSVVARYERQFAFPQQLYVERDHFGATANLIVPAAVMARVGPFDERLQSGGDWEWGQRARRAGVRIVYEPGVRVVHPPRTTVRALLRKNGRVARGAVTLARKRYFRPRQIVSLWGSALLPPMGDVLRALTDARSGPLYARPKVAALRMLLWAQRLAILVRGRAWP